MDNKKVMARVFTISDYEEEEIWFRRQHQQGWKLQRTVLPCFYIFEKCTPEDVAYRLDYKNNTEQADYFQIFQDYGWEYFNRCMGWLYFRKPVAETDSEQDAEIFSDDVSRVRLLNNLLKTRMLPLYSLAVSAGTGQFLDSEDYDMTEVGPEVPDGANFGVRVAGDSMEPRFHDGQTVWVSQQHSLMTGEIGIFLYDGCAYLKQLVAGDGYLALHSLNPAYPDIRISPALPLRVLGKVLAA